MKVGTIFEDSAIALGKWLVVTWQLVNCKNGAASYEIAKAIGTQKTAWFILQRIPKAMQDDRRGGKLSGEVEVDESFIGGKKRETCITRVVLGEARIRSDKDALSIDDDFTRMQDIVIANGAADDPRAKKLNELHEQFDHLVDECNANVRAAKTVRAVRAARSEMLSRLKKATQDEIAWFTADPAREKKLQAEHK